MCRCADVVIHLRAPKRISLGRHIRVGGAYAQRVLFWPMEAVHPLPCYEPTSIMQPKKLNISNLFRFVLARHGTANVTASSWKKEKRCQLVVIFQGKGIKRKIPRSKSKGEHEIKWVDLEIITNILVNWET